MILSIFFLDCFVPRSDAKRQHSPVRGEGYSAGGKAKRNHCRQESGSKQILHPKHARLTNEELGGGKCSQGKALSVEGLVGEGEFVGG